MPAPAIPAAVAAAGLAGGSAIGANLINAVTTGLANRANRKWNEKMYAQQRNDALADWHMQNAYDSPEEQMKRLKAAGLNPNLVYGHGADAGSSSSVRQSSPGSYDPRPIHVESSGIADAASLYFDTKIKEQTAKNMQAQNALTDQQVLEAAARINNINANTAKTAQDTQIGSATLKRAEEIAQTSLDQSKASLDQTRVNTQYTMAQNLRAEMMQGYNVQEAAARIKNIQASTANTKQTTQNLQVDEEAKKLELELRKRYGMGEGTRKALTDYQIIENMRKDGQLKELDIKLKKAGIQPGDPMYMRMLQQWLEEQNKNR